MAWRDAASDSGRLGSSNSPVRGDALTVPQDYDPDTISEQMANGGWTKLNKPEGGPAAPIDYTVGLRGGD